MLEDLREKINIKIQDSQIKKQKLYDEISAIDNELLELNDIMLKVNEKDSFLDISPKEAFNILERIGYTDKGELMDIYLEVIKSLELERDKNLVVDRNYFDY